MQSQRIPLLNIAVVLTALLLPTRPVIAGEQCDLPCKVSFDRHIEPLFARLGCNAGTCHGSAKGKGGFKLSLFGADPGGDFTALTDSRRIDLDSPPGSRLLRKPTAQILHGGGQRLKTGSWEYKVLESWIRQGAKRGPTVSVRRLTISPPLLRLQGANGAGDLRVTATFADGSREDVTAFCTFRSGDEEVAEIDGKGHVTGNRPGFASAIVGYAGAWTSAEVLIPRSVPSDFTCQEIPTKNSIDRVVLERLRQLNIVPSISCTDAEFLRRVTIDVIGGLPTPHEVQAFLVDQRPDKRARKIEELLVHPRHAALWASKFCDWTACDFEALEGPKELRLARSRMWHDWFRKRIQENVPYDRIVRGVLCGTTRDGQDVTRWIKAEAPRLESARTKGIDPEYAKRPFLDLYWRRIDAAGPVPPDRMAELTAAAFLGLRLQCAQCHRHPTDRWTQDDYRAFTNIFVRVRFGLTLELRVAIADLLEAKRYTSQAGPPLPRLQEVFLESDTERYLSDPISGKLVPPRPPGGPVLDDTTDSRLGFVAWMVSPKNPYFARNFANRVWQHYFGRGLIEPLDDFSDARPPDFPELLDTLASEFTARGYDMRGVERLILNSATYQRSGNPNASNGEDESGLARFRPRRPMAEVLIDLLHDAAGVPSDYRPDVPAGARAIEVATSKPMNPFLGRLARTFGRPSRRQVCDCERRSEPVLAESLLLMSDPALLEMTRGGRVARLCQDYVANAAAVEELYLAVLSRLETAEERAAVLEYLDAKKDRRVALQGVLWALINTREFILVH